MEELNFELLLENSSTLIREARDRVLGLFNEHEDSRLVFF